MGHQQWDPRSYFPYTFEKLPQISINLNGIQNPNHDLYSAIHYSKVAKNVLGAKAAQLLSKMYSLPQLFSAPIKNKEIYLPLKMRRVKSGN